MAGETNVVGVDVGGTFTDLILLDEKAGDIRVAKVPTTMDNQAIGVLAALSETGVSMAEVATIVHGTTTTTNAMLERKASPAGLITTAGFRDVLEVGRRTRPEPYGLKGWVRAPDFTRIPLRGGRTHGCRRRGPDPPR